MDNVLIFKEFSTMCSLLSKTSGDNDVFVSNGVFIWRDSGVFSICTFSEKIEKNILHLLHGTYKFNPTIISLLYKYAMIDSVECSDTEIRFRFSNSVSITTIVANITSKADSTLFVENMDKFIKEGDTFIYTIEKVDIDPSIYIIFDKFKTLDLDRNEEIEVDNDIISSSEGAIDIEVKDYSVRIAKSLFGNVNKADKLSMRFVPYTDSTSIFLVMATNCKERCKLINLVDAVRL